MKKEIAEAILEASETIGLNLEMREDYSGRGMYGSKTHAIVGDSDEFLQAACLAAVEISQDNEVKGLLTDAEVAYEAEYQITVEEFIEMMGKLRKDNMGRSDFVWY